MTAGHTLRLPVVYVARVYILSLNLRYGTNVRFGAQTLASNSSSANLTPNCSNQQDVVCVYSQFNDYIY